MEASNSRSGLQLRLLFKRIAIPIFAFTAVAGIAFALFIYAPETHLRHITKESTRSSRCPVFHDANEIWKQSQLKYQDLRDDKFTIAMQTYRRPKELNETLYNLLSEEIPSLKEIVVVWNNVETAPPENYVSKYGVPVRYRHSPVNSLNQKLWPDPAFETQAILLSDDDLYYKPKDLEFVFQSWRKFGRGRMTGSFTRCAVQGSSGQWEYSFCSTDEGNNYYNMILSNLAFAHISFLDLYSSSSELATKIRTYVDEHMNCEDIVMNYLLSMLTGEGPLLVKGKENYVSYVPKVGISTKPGHLEARSQCLNDFNELFGCMPLVNELAHIEFGVILA